MPTEQTGRLQDAWHERKYIDGPTYDGDGIHIRQRFYIGQVDSNLVSGVQIDITFSLAEAPAEVWPYFSDPNLWQNSHGYSYPSSFADLYVEPNGDLGNEKFHITITDPAGNSSVWPDEYRMLMVIPERAIVLHQSVPTDGRNGGVSPGFHVTLLQDGAEGGSVATFFMEHSIGQEHASEDEAVQFWRKEADDIQQFWTESFVPELRRCIREGSA